MELCLNMFLGRCPDCKIDLNEGHHPNNRDCPNFKLMILNSFEVLPIPSKKTSKKDK